MVTYEGTSQVKNIKITIYQRQYELKMPPNDNIKEMSQGLHKSLTLMLKEKSSRMKKGLKSS